MELRLKTCANCRHGATKDVFYSDYTIEGTNFHCLESLNPGIDRWGISWESYEDHSEFPYAFANDCRSYREGNRLQHYGGEEKLPFRIED